MNNEPIFSVLTGKGVECTGDLYITATGGTSAGSTGCYVKNGSGADANWQFDDYATNEKIWYGYWSSTDTLTVYEFVNLGGQGFTITFDHNLGDYKVVSGSYTDGQGTNITVSCGC
jgi:hypothetical protein